MLGFLADRCRQSGDPSFHRVSSLLPQSDEMWDIVGQEDRACIDFRWVFPDGVEQSKGTRTWGSVLNPSCSRHSSQGLVGTLPLYLAIPCSLVSLRVPIKGDSQHTPKEFRPRCHLTVTMRSKVSCTRQSQVQTTQAWVDPSLLGMLERCFRWLHSLVYKTHTATR